MLDQDESKREWSKNNCIEHSSYMGDEHRERGTEISTCDRRLQRRVMQRQTNLTNESDGDARAYRSRSENARGS
jgi:hypothetical protein